MALQECLIHVNQDNKELRPHGSPAFPIAGYEYDYTDAPEDVVTWHWHEELEFVYAVSGTMQVRIPSETFHLQAGDVLLINANMLHYAIAEPACHLRSLVFHPLLVEGSADAVFATRYVRPVLSCPSFTGLLVPTADREMLAGYFNAAHAALANDAPGYEFTVRENLSHICLYLYNTLAPESEPQSGSLTQDNLRVRQMLAYMHVHYAENITLADIAREADVSERECLRCFQKTIQQSPIQYLLKYRITQGAGMLVHSPGESIQEIASHCGFDSQSNFAKMFKRYYGRTPREYRKARAVD